jgi:hypothetical protein
LHVAANAGIGLQSSAKGVLSLGPARVNGKSVHAPFVDWLGTGGVSGGAASLGYLLTPDRDGTFRPHQPTDGVPLPVLATERVAAESGPHGIIPLQVEGEQVAARIVGVLRRFPSVDGDAVIADRQAASTLLDTRSPGLGTIDELWVNVPAAREPSAAAALSRPPFTQLSVQSRAATLAGLQADPLARGSSACCSRWLETCATTAGICSISRRRARRPRRSVLTCGCAHFSSVRSACSAESPSARS